MDQKRFSVGRDLGADIPIADASVSRRHAEVTPLEGGRLFVTDCKSSNGTFRLRAGMLSPLTQETLLPTDQVKFGNVTLSVEALLEAIGRRSPAVKGAAPAPAARPDARLVRCDCGAVKPENGPCPACSR